jgi:phosphoenolpyruvate carboxykinase (GTP)
VAKPPRIFHVNWFRQNAEGKFLWPGFGENLRVIKWVVARCAGTGRAEESPIGLLPAAGEIDTAGLDVTPATMQTLFDVPRAEWNAEAENMGEFFAKFGKRLPDEIERQRRQLMDRLGN